MIDSFTYLKWKQLFCFLLNFYLKVIENFPWGVLYFGQVKMIEKQMIEKTVENKVTNCQK